MDRRIVVQRTAYGTLAIAVLLVLFAADAWIAAQAAGGQTRWSAWFRHGSVIPVTTMGVFFLGAVELVRLQRATGARPSTWQVYPLVIALIAAPWAAAAGFCARTVDSDSAWATTVLLLTIAAVVCVVTPVIRRETRGSLRDAGATWLIVGYLGFFGSFAVRIHCAENAHGHVGGWLLLYIVLVTKASDIGAYFVGSAIGRHRLIPAVSPGKSVEGTIGGLLGSALVAVGLAAALAAAATGTPGTPAKAPSIGLFEFAALFRSSVGAHGLPAVAGFGALLSLAGQMGDLVESCFKRDASVKDSGHVIPWFGGILDLIDSLVLAMPLGWFLLRCSGTLG
ncbi:MAG: phosphatidate cytidylyltransferase [Planctomycetes bacterium]|nr:phosphatidate cytidylyltransferase [Planctomycetota bacterium]